MVTQGWNTALFESFRTTGEGVIRYFPRLLLAIVVFFLGWIIADILGRFVSQAIDLLKIDRILAKTGLEEALKRGNIPLHSGAFIGGLVRWFLLIVFLLAAFEILGLSQLNIYLREVVLQYLPHVIAAARGAVCRDRSAAAGVGSS